MRKINRMKRSKDNTGQFDEFYENFYHQRWSSLRCAMMVERVPVPFSEGLLKPYYLDESSLEAVRQLSLEKGDAVLDMCAAPGGKTLVMAVALAGSGRLVCNDRSSQRRGRLRKVVEEHLHEPWRQNITFTSHDAAKWGLYERDAYDAVLLDAPCSSERHVLASPSAMNQWSASRTKHLAIQQFAMLAAALDAVRIGGHVLYCTCSISPLENEKVIEKLSTKRTGRFEVEDINGVLAESLSYGAIVLPDKAQGKGPLYMCLIRRIA